MGLQWRAIVAQGEGATQHFRGRILDLDPEASKMAPWVMNIKVSSLVDRLFLIFSKSQIPAEFNKFLVKISSGDRVISTRLVKNTNQCQSSPVLFNNYHDVCSQDFSLQSPKI